jgi:hypothetical protein
MAHIDIPQFKPIPPGATLEERTRLYEEWCDELRRRNPIYYNADGSQKKWWQMLLGPWS